MDCSRRETLQLPPRYFIPRRYRLGRSTQLQARNLVSMMWWLAPLGATLLVLGTRSARRRSQYLAKNQIGAHNREPTNNRVTLYMCRISNEADYLLI